MGTVKSNQPQIGEYSMSEEHYFGIGFIAGMLISLGLVIFAISNKTRKEESGYVDKMTISYHCPGKEYERRLFREIVYNSGIQTNFVNTQTTMDKHKISIRMTNPKND